MSGQSVTVRGNGVGLPALVFIVFLVLKLTHVIDWSWWWVTAPLWISLALWVLIATMILGAAATATSSRRRPPSRTPQWRSGRRF